MTTPAPAKTPVKVSTVALVAVVIAVAAAFTALIVFAPTKAEPSLFSAAAPARIQPAAAPAAAGSTRGAKTSPDSAADRAALRTFTAKLRKANFSAAKAESFAGAGKRICADLSSGAATKADVESDLTDNVGFSTQDAVDLVQASASAYCPQQLTAG